MYCDICGSSLQPGATFCPNGHAQISTADKPLIVIPSEEEPDTLLPRHAPLNQPQAPLQSPFNQAQAPLQSPFNQAQAPLPPPFFNQAQAPLPPPFFNQAQAPLPPPFFNQAQAPLPHKPQRRLRLPILLLLIFMLLLVIFAVVGIFFWPKLFSPMPKPLSSFSFSDSIAKANDGEYIGISDGTFAFDTDRADGKLKQQAADDLKAGKIADAESLWKQGLARDTNDAEALIYQEDQRVLAFSSTVPYITLVVGTILTGTLKGSGRDSLQGAYVAQKEHNDKCNFSGCGLQIRLLVANAGSGNEVSYASMLMEQIVRLRKADSTFVGVMGWPASSASFYANTVLKAAGIPIISPTASSDSSIMKPPYLFSVAPSNKEQGMRGAQYATEVLHDSKIALFFDPTDPYSQSIASAFSQTALSSIVVTENYTVGAPQTLPDLLQDALRYTPDLIYFAGYPQDAGALLVNLPGCSLSRCLQVMGGDALYDYGDYSKNARAYLPRLHFTALAYPDEWSALAPSQQLPPFFSDYPQYFDPNKQYTPNSVYGYTRASSSTMLSYDAMQVLLDASNLAFTEGKQTFTASDLQHALTQITGPQATQGISGRISFGSDGNSMNKVVIVLHMDSSFHTQFDYAYGCFLKPQLTSSSSTGCG